MKVSEKRLSKEASHTCKDELVSLDFNPIAGDENHVMVASWRTEQRPNFRPLVPARKAAAIKIRSLHGQADRAVFQQPIVRLGVLGHAFDEKLAHGLAKYLRNPDITPELLAEISWSLKRTYKTRSDSEYCSVENSHNFNVIVGLTGGV